MPAAVTYTTVLGQVLMENRGGIVTEFVPDPLGSVVKHKDSTGAYVHSAEYWPYGEIQTSTGNNPNNFAYCGTWGYYRDNASQTYVRARYYRPVQGRWMTVDPLWPREGGYVYGNHSPVYVIDYYGTRPDPGSGVGRRFSRPPTCKEVSDCLGTNPPSCEANAGKQPPSVALMMCIFWQETNFTPPGNANEGIGNVTKAAFEELVRLGCSWLRGWRNFQDFKDKATDCQKARAGYEYATLKGWRAYGPGKGKPGDYRGPTGDRICKCEECMNSLQGPSGGSIETDLCRQCFRLVHL